VVPTGDWYHFRAKRPFVPMGAEEAEEHVRVLSNSLPHVWGRVALCVVSHTHRTTAHTRAHARTHATSR
jgi:hypothetical protein